jgi:hypothetical protein
MTISDLLTPWLLLAAVLIPFIFAEKWIHSHLYGVGWLLTNDYKSATALYYLILFPGVFIHEFVQWLVAGALNVRAKRVMAWPEAQKNGTLRLDFVQIQKADRTKSAIIGAAPLIVGVAIVWYISNRILNLEDFLTALGTGEPEKIGSTIQDLGRTADFYLWLYLMFAISNAMIPTPADRKGWPLLIGIFAACLGFLVLIGVGDVLMETFTGPVAHRLNLLTTALATVLTVELIAILSIGFIEEVLERLTKRKFVYSTTPPAREPEQRQPGSNLPLPPGAPLPSIYSLKLPIPDSSIQNSLDTKAKRRAAAMPQRVAPALASAEDADVRPGRIAQPTLGGPSRTPALTDEEPSGIRRPDSSPLERPGAFSRPGAPAFGASRTPAADDEDTDDEKERPTTFRRPSTGLPSRPGAPTFGASRTPSADDEEERSTDFRRPSTGLPSRPGAFLRPGAPTFGASRTLSAEDEEADDEDDDLGDDEEDQDEEDVEYVDFDDL